MSHDFWVYLKDDVAREWQQVLGPDRGKRLPVRTPIPQLAQLPGYDIPQQVYLLALEQMQPAEIYAIAGRLAHKFELHMDEALEELRRVGIPIREEHVSSVIVHNPQKWF